MPVIASEFWRFTIYQALATIVQIVLLRLDVLLVGGIENSKQAGIYSAASRYLTPGVMFSTAIVFVVGPQLAGMIARKDFDRARNVYQTATLWLSVLSFPMYIALAVYATLLMRIFGPGFSAGRDGAADPVHRDAAEHGHGRRPLGAVHGRQELVDPVGQHRRAGVRTSR